MLTPLVQAPARDARLGGSDIRSGAPGQTSLALLAHPLDGRGHTLSAARVCFQYTSGYGCGPKAPGKLGASVTLSLLDVVDGTVVADVGTSAPLANYSFDAFTTESPPVCVGAAGLAVSHPRQLQLGLRFVNHECNLQLPMATMNVSVAWGGMQAGPYAAVPLPSVTPTERWTRDLPMAAAGERVSVRLLYRRDMVELYVNGYAMFAIDVPTTSGLVGLSKPDATESLRWWPMRLPGGPYL